MINEFMNIEIGMNGTQTGSKGASPAMDPLAQQPRSSCNPATAEKNGQRRWIRLGWNAT